MRAVENRRRFERYALKPMYTPLALTLPGEDGEGLDGHAYDISEGGIQFELDFGIDPGTEVDLEIFLPHLGDPRYGDEGPGRSIRARARIVWMQIDEDEPGPVRQAAVFLGFDRIGDRERLLKRFASDQYRLAA